MSQIKLETDAGVEVTVIYNYTQGAPAKLSGPMEDCYPEEGDEIEILGVKGYDGLAYSYSQEEEETWCDQIYDYEISKAEADACDRADYEYDAMKERELEERDQ